ncbi:Imidazole glycerol phosphate synthase subunit HisF [Candidatus Hodgkinia cicadicola]|uniref:Imidazole glycerol phosphate synthase subunit HisF n=1 Tax=Candidatus Hodgkinia cicadicola TaxID=573658 RepID=A0ABX4MFH5_9HYPH|nr:Imidazole glycerol phosphate synthase subunit HisF [Candidatus Hodgkinia cicadicola]PIM96940.1 Imidazole glycerol phosphate synthase subunit HisF [Candidatus Hodgkinia cicadicola]
MTNLTVRIIPCINVNYNNVVKSIKFSNLTTIGSPSLLVNKYSVSGADELCLLDVIASSDNKMILYDTISGIADTYFFSLKVDVGIRTTKDVECLLEAGSNKVAINSASVVNPRFVTNSIERFESQCIVSSVGCKTVNGTWEVFGHSGLRSTEIDVLEHICKLVQYGTGEILLTSVDKDGTNDGYDTFLLKSVSQFVSIPVVASGGRSEFRHIVLAIIERDVSTVLLASALYYDKYSVSQLKYFLGRCGILVWNDYLSYGLCD